MKQIHQAFLATAIALCLVSGAQASFPPQDPTIDITAPTVDAFVVIDEATGKTLETKEGTTNPDEAAQELYRTFQQSMQEEAETYAAMASGVAQIYGPCMDDEVTKKSMDDYRNTAAFFLAIKDLAEFDPIYAREDVATDNIMGMTELVDAMKNLNLRVSFDADAGHTARVTPTGAMGIYDVSLNVPGVDTEALRNATFMLADITKIVHEEHHFGMALGFTLRQSDDPERGDFIRKNLATTDLFNRISGCTASPAP